MLKESEDLRKDTFPWQPLAKWGHYRAERLLPWGWKMLLYPLITHNGGFSDPVCRKALQSFHVQPSMWHPFCTSQKHNNSPRETQVFHSTRCLSWWMMLGSKPGAPSCAKLAVKFLVLQKWVSQLVSSHSHCWGDLSEVNFTLKAVMHSPTLSPNSMHQHSSPGPAQSLKVSQATMMMLPLCPAQQAEDLQHPA